MSQKERQLLVAVEKGQTKMIETLISQGTCVNCKARDDGSTPLIKAAKCRNHVVQKLLLQNGADISAKNSLGLTALHYTAEAGDTETLKLLLAYKSPVDAPDVEGCTPLHYAAHRKNLATTEILIFCGANADFKNKKRQSPFATNRNEIFRELARQSRKVLEAIEHKDIIIEHDELHPGETSHLKNIGLKVFTPDNFKLHSLSFLCRRVRPELCADSLKPVGKEILISDGFEYITSTVHVKGEVDLEVPLYDHHDPYEIIQIKSDKGNIEDPSAIVEGPTTYNEHSGVLRWKLRIRLDITKTNSFILITIPKVERFEVTPNGGEFVSEVDKFINIKVAPDTFQTGTVDMEVIPTPVYKSENFKNILSIGHFYDLHHSLGCNQFQKNGVTLTSPLPHEFENEGELCVLAADIPLDFDPDLHLLDENIWEILDRDPKTKKGRVSCDLSHFSTHVLAEKRKGTTDAIFKAQVNKIHTKACKRAKVVCFFAVLKPQADFLYEVILECTIPQKVNDRLNHWKTENYIALSPKCTGAFDALDKQEYNIIFRGNIQKMAGSTKLQFHSKRKLENFQTIAISLENPDKQEPGSLDIVEMPEKQEVTSILLWLSNMSAKYTPPKYDDSFKGFTREKLLKKIASKLGTEWTRFCVLLGIPFRKVDKIRNKSFKDNSTENKIMQLLLDWRKKSQHLDDMGVIDLVTALSRVGRNDIANVVHENLREWLKENEIEKEGRFYKWAENAIKGTLKISRKEDYIEPMSDEFFVVLVEKFANPEFQNLGVLLEIPENQNSNIFADTTFPNYQYKVLHMFIVAREKQNDRLNALTILTEALEITKNNDCLQWVQDCMNKWSQKSKNKKRTKFQLDLEKLIRREAGEDIEEDEESDFGEDTELNGDHKGGNKKMKPKQELDTQKSVTIKDNGVKLSKESNMKEEPEVKQPEHQQDKFEERSELKEDENQDHPEISENNDHKIRNGEKEENIRNNELSFIGHPEKNSENFEHENQESKEVKLVDKQPDQSKCSNSDLKNLEKSEVSDNEVKEDKPSKIQQDDLKDDDTEDRTSNATNSDDSNEKYSEGNTLEMQQNKHIRYNSEHNEKPQVENTVSDSDINGEKSSDNSHKKLKDNGSDLDDDELLDKIHEKSEGRDSHIGTLYSEEQQVKPKEGPFVDNERAYSEEYESKENESLQKDGFLDKGEEMNPPTRIAT